ncbi:uncharacterized protein DUF1311 [Mucilaginibacter gracilis]|uniref:Uncharacterized protein DUF1311 n=1 Tax=Mucilaginibacter gracilis TaxID=423350 RepID=A0A495J1P9_9SPHI|nr:lysozyme inhibitor LprI family protein [Mucilaginibacter gracilis]RKR82733.1 uncharacterized protein DUF1311 [Mucilaginibacter gracilis]
MKRIVALAALLVLSFSLRAQLSFTPEQNKTIANAVEQKLAVFKAKLVNLKVSAIESEFAIDTFKVEHLMAERLNTSYVTSDMIITAGDASRGYDLLLNKYYKKLMSVLKDTDKQVLLQTQKNWIAFRDSESKLIGVIGGDKYTGGTMQAPIDAELYLQLIKKRTCDIYEHYSRIADQP